MYNKACSKTTATGWIYNYYQPEQQKIGLIS